MREFGDLKLIRRCIYFVVFRHFSYHVEQDKQEIKSDAVDFYQHFDNYFRL